MFVTGLKSVEIGVPSDEFGGLPTVWAKINDIAEGTVEKTIPALKLVSIRVDDRPGVRLKVADKAQDDPTLNLSTIDVSNENALKFFGGTLDTVNNIYRPPLVPVLTRLSVRLTTGSVEGRRLIETYPTVDFVASQTGKYAPGGEMITFVLTGTPVNPVDADGNTLDLFTRQFVSTLPAVITVQPQSKTVATGADSTISITANHYQSITWFKDGVATGQTGPIYNITAASNADQASYTARVLGDDDVILVSAAANVTVD